MTVLAKTNTWSLAPASLGELMEFARLVADSELAPKDYRGKPGNVMIAIQMGADLGLAPMQAIQGISVINGRASVWGDLMLALVQSSPLCEDVVEMSEAEISAKGYATCTAKRKGRGDKTATFSIEDAKKARLWTKEGPWTNYPMRMLKMRARAWALRDQFSDVLRGIASAEEQTDIVQVKATVLPLDPPDHAVPALPADTWGPEHEKVWPLYANSSVVGQPLTTIPIEKLATYIERLEATLKGPKTSKTPEAAEKAARAKRDAPPWYAAAKAEMNERLKMQAEMAAEAEAAGANPETGEVPDPEAEAPFQAEPGEDPAGDHSA